MPPFIWERSYRGNVLYIKLAGVADAMVRCKPSPNGRYMWQYRKIVSYADTIAEAMNYVEAGYEFLTVMGRNPYSTN